MRTSMFGFMELVIIFALLAMAVTGVVLIVMSKGRGPSHPSCGSCGYDLSGTIGTERRCPECGADFGAAGITPPGGTRRVGRLVTGIILLVMSVGCVGIGGAMALWVAGRQVP